MTVKKDERCKNVKRREICKRERERDDKEMLTSERERERERESM